MLAIVFLSIGKGQSQQHSKKIILRPKVAKTLDRVNTTVLKSFEASLDACKALMKDEGDAQRLSK